MSSSDTIDELRLTFPASPRDQASVVDAIFRHSPARPWTLFGAAIIGLLGVGVFVQSLSSSRSLLTAVVEAVPLLSLSAFFGWGASKILSRLYLGALRRGAPNGGLEIRTLSAEGLFYSSVLGSQHVPWSSVRKVVETDEHILFFPNVGIVSYIPKYAIPVERETQLQALLSDAFVGRPQRLRLLSQR
jgi:hypothetical protein